MSVVKVLKASRAEELIKKRRVKFAHLPKADWLTRQSQLKSSERKRKEKTKRGGERRERDEGGGDSTASEKLSVHKTYLQQT